MNTGVVKKKRNNEESRIQKSCVSWFKIQYRKNDMMLFAIPNGAVLKGNERQRSIQMANLKKEGLTPGVADLFLSIPSGEYAGLYVEMKTKKGKQRDNQKEFERQVLTNGFGYILCRSLDQFMNDIKNYLENGEY